VRERLDYIKRVDREKKLAKGERYVPLTLEVRDNPLMR
jgi:hypothetical protein